MIQQLTSIHHPLVKRLAHLRRHPTVDRVVIEGKKMVTEAAAHTSILTLLASDAQLFPDSTVEGTHYLVTNTVIRKVAGSRNPEGIVAEVIKPQFADISSVARLLILDGVADPGNVGTLLRSALALGWDGAYIINGCCDPYNDKALRAAKGATFRIAIGRGSWEQLNSSDRTLLAAAATGGIPLSDVDVTPPIGLILGSETHGISATAAAVATGVTIPITAIESLNVAAAGAILLHALHSGEHNGR